MGFHSLQTGRHFRTRKVPFVDRYYHYRFPFPSTGTAFPNDDVQRDCERDPSVSFHSLQPGRHFQTPILLNPCVRGYQKPSSKSESNCVFFANDTTHRRKCQIFLIRWFFACAHARQELNAVQGCQCDTSRTQTPCDAQCVDILPRKSAAKTVPALPQTELYRRIRPSGQHALSGKTGVLSASIASERYA